MNKDNKVKFLPKMLNNRNEIIKEKLNNERFKVDSSEDVMGIVSLKSFKWIIKKKYYDTDIDNLYISDVSSEKSFSSISCSSIDIELDDDEYKPIIKRPTMPFISNIFKQDSKIYTEESFVLPKYKSELQVKNRQSNLFTKNK